MMSSVLARRASGFASLSCTQSALLQLHRRSESNPSPLETVPLRAFWSWGPSKPPQSRNEPVIQSIQDFGPTTQLDAVIPMENAGGISQFLHIPLDAVASMLSAIHTTTGFPWWLTIAGSTLAMRIIVFPLTVIQLRKTAELVRLFPKLLPKVAVKDSKFWEMFQTFNQHRLKLHAPSPLWFVAPAFVQVPLFICWMVSVRHMAITCYPGFEEGGALWFVDLTIPVQGYLGALFPLLVASTHLAHVEISFMGPAMKAGVMANMMDGFKWWLRLATIPMVAVGFYLPQGVFMYWLTNNFWNLSQVILLKNKAVREALHLPSFPKRDALGKTRSIDELSYNELIMAAADFYAHDRREEATRLLKFAVKKYPESPVGYNALGKINAEQKKWNEAAEFYSAGAEKANDIDARLVALLGTGIAMYQQGKLNEGIDVLKPVAELQVPEDLDSKHRYFRSLVVLGSMLNQVGRKKEALVHLERAAEYDPNIGKFYVNHLKGELEGVD